MRRMGARGSTSGLAGCGGVDAGRKSGASSTKPASGQRTVPGSCKCDGDPMENSWRRIENVTDGVSEVEEV